MNKLTNSRKKALKKYLKRRDKRYLDLVLKTLLFVFSMHVLWALVEYDYYFVGNTNEILNRIWVSFPIAFLFTGYDLWKNEKDIKKFESQLLD